MLLTFQHVRGGFFYTKLSLMVKCPIVKWFFVLHNARISFHLARLLDMDVILYHTAFLRSFRDLSLSFWCLLYSVIK